MSRNVYAISCFRPPLFRTLAPGLLRKSAKNTYVLLSNIRSTYVPHPFLIIIYCLCPISDEHLWFPSFLEIFFPHTTCLGGVNHPFPQFPSHSSKLIVPPSKHIWYFPAALHSWSKCHVPQILVLTNGFPKVCPHPHRGVFFAYSLKTK